MGCVLLLEKNDMNLDGKVPLSWGNPFRQSLAPDGVRFGR